MGTLQHQRLLRLLDQLKLRRVIELYEGVAEEAGKKDWTYVDYLEKLLEAEAALRQERTVIMKMQMARFPFQKTLDQFEFSFQPSLDRKLVKSLSTLKFVEERENVLLLGPPGVGKTHLAIALGLEAIKAGYPVYFATAADLMASLERAQAKGQLEARMRNLLKPKLLVIDELGYLPLEPWEASQFFQLVSARYEKGSILLTSNKSYGEWGEIFPDAVMAAAILDRLLHHSTTVNIKGESYRLKGKRKAGLVNLSAEAMDKAAQPSAAS